MKKVTLLILTACSVFSLTACGTNNTDTASASGNNVVVDTSVGQITKDELYNKLKNKDGNQVLRDMIYTKVLEKNFPVTDQEVNDEVQRVKKNFPSDDAFKQALTQHGIKDENQLKEQIRQNLLQFKAVTKDVTVADADVKKLYEERKDEVHASHILIKYDKAAKEVEAKLKSGQDFATLAKQYSIDTGSAVKGGDLGFFGKGKMVPEFEKVAFSLPIGKISDPVKSKYGYHIIKVTEKRVTPYADMEKNIRRELMGQKAKPLQPILDDLVKKDKVDIKDKDLADALKANPSTAMPPQ
ncbi:peptidylprolyl isomerase [Aneurinibacillus tyrosinisolvens]|uniref:peptidylprolyl isomerase n=1 Tax=Aneurinibacillus tyrosinisolvens TaxID=1443435 RepID=UPI00063FB038|nr:peptidylprolyl isomerase [Aneurinibacillus tyrosinisolvens]